MDIKKQAQDGAENDLEILILKDNKVLFVNGADDNGTVGAKKIAPRCGLEPRVYGFSSPDLLIKFPDGDFI